jgi:DNA modification methylase
MQMSLPLFDIDNEKVEYNFIHRDKATFKSGVARAVHSWFRLTPSFGPELVKMVLDEFEYKKTSVILDPFSGASTTLIECQLMDIKSYGFEINPFLNFVGKTTLNWDLSYALLSELRDEVSSNFKRLKDLHKNVDVEQLPYSIPVIHNVYRWWRKDVLRDLVLLKNSIIETTASYGNEYRDFFFLSLAGVLVPDLTNVTLGKLQLHFIDRNDDNIDVFFTYSNHLDKMINDFKAIKELGISNHAHLFHTDSTSLDNVDIKDKIDFVMTSPPYPNRYSYVWNTRPFLFFFDFFNSPKSASDLDLKTIGGTWGTATSILAKGTVEPINSAVEEFVKPITEQIRISDNLMANYVMKYFNLLTKQVLAMDKFLSSKAKIAYVVGNSEIKGVFVETDILLSKILKAIDCNYSQTRINRFRKRNSGKNLFESIVYGEK